MLTLQIDSLILVLVRELKHSNLEHTPLAFDFKGQRVVSYLGLTEKKLLALS